jgi:pilus assembly protein Flp/PilA
MRAQMDTRRSPFVVRFVTDERAATAIEYTLIAAGVALVIIATVTAIGNQLRANYFDKMGAGLQ